MEVQDYLDLVKNELRNARIHNLGSAPSSPVTGQVYYDTGSNRLFFYNGAGWIDAQARANHSGTQTAATISDFDTQVRTSRLDQMSAPTAAVSLNSQKITNVDTPTNPNDAANKAYVDSVATGLDVKASVRAATTAPITLSGTQTVDGVALAIDDRALVKDQAAAETNGIYNVKAGAWVRSTDADTSAEVTTGLYVFVSEGTVNADSGWILTTNDPIVLNTTSLAFVQFTGAGQVIAGAGLTKTGNTLDVGQGTGISVAADTVGIDTAVVARKFTANLVGSLTAYVVNHGLANQKVMVQVYRTTAPYDLITTDIERTDANNITVRFGTAPASNAFEVVVIG